MLERQICRDSARSPDFFARLKEIFLLKTADKNIFEKIKKRAKVLKTPHRYIRCKQRDATIYTKCCVDKEARMHMNGFMETMKNKEVLRCLDYQ